MSSRQRTPPSGGTFSSRFSAYAGLFFDEFDPNSAWIRERAYVRLPPLEGVTALVIKVEVRPHPEARGCEVAAPGLRLAINGTPAGGITASPAGPWELRVPLAKAEARELSFELTGVGLTNLLAWLGRLTGLGFWQRFRAQNKNRQLRIATIATDTGETIFDFSRRDAP